MVVPVVVARLGRRVHRVDRFSVLLGRHLRGRRRSRLLQRRLRRRRGTLVMRRHRRSPLGLLLLPVVGLSRRLRCSHRCNCKKCSINFAEQKCSLKETSYNIKIFFILRFEGCSKNTFGSFTLRLLLLLLLLPEQFLLLVILFPLRLICQLLLFG